MAISTKKIEKKRVSENELPRKKYPVHASVHVFKKSKIPMSVSMAKKAPKIFNITA